MVYAYRNVRTGRVVSGIYTSLPLYACPEECELAEGLTEQEIKPQWQRDEESKQEATTIVDKEATAQIEKIVTPNQQRLLLARALHGIGTLLVQKQLITPEEFQQAAGPGLQAFGQAEQILADAERKKTEL